MPQPRVVSIQQPSYMPWLGHFEMIHRADVFLFFDDVQYTKRDWRNRNRIRVDDEAHYLTVPIANAHHPLPLLTETRILENGWRAKHRRTLQHAYAKAPFRDETLALVDEILAIDTDNLAAFNAASTERIAAWLGLACAFGHTSALGIPNDLERTERVARICEAVGVQTLYNGQTAKARGLIDLEVFAAHGLGLSYQVFEALPYPQTGAGFVPRLSVLDALFCTGIEGTRALIAEGGHLPEEALAPALPG